MFTTSPASYHCTFTAKITSIFMYRYCIFRFCFLFFMLFFGCFLFARHCDISFSYIVVRAISHMSRSQWSFLVWQFGLGCHLLLGVSLGGVSTSTVLCDSVLRSLFNILTGLDQQIGFVSDSLLCFTIAFGVVCLGICFSRFSLCRAMAVGTEASSCFILASRISFTALLSMHTTLIGL